MRNILVLILAFTARSLFAAWGANYDLDELPIPATGFKTMFVAKEPELMHEVCMCFDKHGNLMVAGGAQFRWPKPETPKDKIKILFDKDGDGKADQIKIFADGFNCIQAMAWKGDDLWVCHCPDVTICRDTDGDGEADEFIDVFTGLGPLRHGLHGFNWGPDGKLYMSQGNNMCTKEAPKAWRDLMHVVSDAPATQPLRKYTKAEWKSHHITPYNDETEGGVLRCNADASELEIFARGMRNPWDIAFDSEFNWIGGDNDDGPEHDRVFGFFNGANMGHRHPWNKSWTGANAPGVAPSSALFPDANGSAVGVVYYTSDHFPPEYRNGYFMGDSDGERVYFFKPEWDGAQVKVKLDTFAKTKAIGKSALFMPTDVEVGPDGALYVISWGSTYGSKWAPYHKGRDEKATINEGRVFKFWHEKSPLIPRTTYHPAKRDKAYKDWTFAELLEDMGHQIPVWRVSAQDEIVRRGKATKDDLIAAINSGKLTTAQETWTVWALGRIDVGDAASDKFFEALLSSKTLNQRIQGARILTFRKATNSAAELVKFATDKEPRLRLEIAQAIWHLNAKAQLPALLEAAAVETDRVVFYSQWRGLQELESVENIKKLLEDSRAGVRKAAFLAALETSSLKGEDVLALARDKDSSVRKIASQWLAKLGKDLPADKLVDMLLDPEPDTRNTALQCLSRTKLTPGTVQKLKELHAKSTGKDRGMLLLALASDSDALKTLWEDVGSTDVDVRMAAIGGLGKHEIHFGKFFVENLEKATPAQRDGGLVALSSFRKIDFPLDANVLKALTDTYASPDPVARKAVVDLLAMMAVSKDAELKKSSGELARKASIDAEPDVRRAASEACKALGVEALQRKQQGIQIDQVVPLVAKGDPEKGKALFFSTKASCTSCHQMEGKGGAIGPDLSDIGLRADAKGITESVLDPSKVIIEGFQPLLVKTKDGHVYAGLIRDDSDEALWVVDTTGKVTEIPKKEIAIRKTQNVSFMPDRFSEVLSAEEAADLVSWLLTLKTAKTKSVKGGLDN